MSFVPLRVHSYYSLMRAVPSLEALVDRAVADGLTALPLTDWGALFGAVRFAGLCREHGLTPITGIVVPVEAPEQAVGVAAAPDELVLLATGPQGYRSLSRLATELQASPNREGYQTRGLPAGLLGDFAEGVVCLTGGRRGALDRLARDGRDQSARVYLSRLAPLFPERLYIGLELHGAEDEPRARWLVGEGERAGIPAVTLRPVYLLDPADRPLLRLLMAMAANRRLEEIDESGLPAGDDQAIGLDWPSSAEMAGLYHNFPEALARTAEVAACCRPALPDGRPLWPVLKLPAGHSADEELAAAAEAGVAGHYGASGADIRARLDKELDLIGQHGFAPLFLILADAVRYARTRRIPVNTRGSVANSLVAFALGITDVDPIEHDLLFERFLNPARRELPDIDLDFCSRRRDEVLTYIRETYGEERVALVATINFFRPRSAVREVAKAHGFSTPAINALSGRLPRGWHPDPRRRPAAVLAGLLAGEDLSPLERRVIILAGRLIGFPSHLGLHPGGVVISPPPAMRDVCPLFLAPKGFLATQFDYRDVELLGLVKVDLLGIRALSVIDHAEKLIRAGKDSAFAIERIPDEDPETAKILTRGRTIGCFQAESTGAMRTLRQLRASTVRDLAVANAFFKPGPATGGMAAAFVRRYRDEAPVTYLHQSLAPILSGTKGVLLFQEQVLRIAVEIAGLDWAAANRIRKGISKFRESDLRVLENRFLAGCRERSGLSQAQAETLWQQVLAFSGYGFNQGHATSYATPTYRMAYLKAHFPAEFFAARLSESGGYHHPAVYVAEARALGLIVRPPHINHSRRRFALGEEGRTLWAGLGGVRDLRRKTIKAIVAARRQAPFTSLADFRGRIPVQPRELDHLIRCGALDGLGAHRAAMLAEASRRPNHGQVRQLTLFEAPGVPTPPPETAAERLAWEKELIGFPLSDHPAGLIRREAADLAVRDVPHSGGRPVAAVGVRVPGWTGGSGFYLDDGHGLVLVKAAGDVRPAAWLPLRVTGRYREDRWGGGWLEAERLEKIGP